MQLPLHPLGFTIAGKGSLSLTSPASSTVPDQKYAAMQQCRWGVYYVPGTVPGTVNKVPLAFLVVQWLRLDPNAGDPGSIPG